MVLFQEMYITFSKSESHKNYHTMHFALFHTTWYMDIYGDGLEILERNKISEKKTDAIGFDMQLVGDHAQIQAGTGRKMQNWLHTASAWTKAHGLNWKTNKCPELQADGSRADIIPIYRRQDKHGNGKTLPG